MKQLSFAIILALGAPWAHAAQSAQASGAVSANSGTWTGTARLPGAEDASAFRVGWNVDERGGVYGGFTGDTGNALIQGRWDGSQVRASVFFEDRQGSFTCDPAHDPVRISVTLGDAAFELDGVRSAPSMDADLDLLVPTAIERPMQVHRDGLPEYWSTEVGSRIRAVMETARIVGLSAAFIVDGEVIDVRSFGWQDYRRRVPASHQTMYRWASISKSMTGALAAQLALEGKLDLARDVREYVPEFPEKQYPVTLAELLCHQAGIVHYQHGPIRSDVTYAEADPYQDGIKALDMFKESPLLFEPGTQYSYSTHGFVLAGAALGRAGGKSFAQLVDERIAKPLGMESLQPDFQPNEIPNRTRGYCRAAGGYVIDSGDSNVAWKLAGGGFISTVEDLARFGAGLMGDTLLDERARELMCAGRTTRDGTDTGYGLGIGIGELRGKPTWSHSGAQRKASTFMLLYPELRLGVCMMSNTEGAPLGPLAFGLLELMLGDY